MKAKESKKKLSEIVSDSENEESDDMYEDFGKSNKAKVRTWIIASPTYYKIQ